MSISSKGMAVMNSMVNDIMERLLGECGKLARYNKKATLATRDVQAATRLLLGGELAKHAVLEGSKAVAKYATQ